MVGLWLADTDSLGYVATDYAFLLSAQVVASPPQITLSWPAKTIGAISIQRKLASDSAWGPVIATLPGNATSFTDNNVSVGQAYEYQVSGMFTDSSGQIAYGYICAAIQLPSQDRRGRVVLIVDRTHADALAGELETLRADLVGDGWTVARYDVAPTDSVVSVKTLIRNEYNADPANVRAVFLFGHIPVPYSGLINPDMHDDHLGAWPADVFYGDMDGAWTDQSVNKPDAGYDENNNIPGDGKFDQSTIPGVVELEVGRVDLGNLPSFAPRTERDLLRNYLNKNHKFRHRVTILPLRGLVRDNFGVLDDDAPAVDAWRAYPALFGKGAYLEVGFNQFFPTLASQGYLWAYGGGGGSFTKADGVGTTTNFAASDPKAAFILLHGSYFGDWNNADNFLRAALATPTYSVATIFSSLPHWYFHPLALGETIGYATRLTQNNRHGLYRNQSELSTGEIHISMLGDPTLRPLPLAPPGNLRLTAGTNLVLAWDPSWQAIDGYHVYHADSVAGPFERMDRRTVTTTSFAIDLPSPGHHVYMVRAVALQTTGSGSFNNLSQGIFAQFDRAQTALPQITIASTDASGDENGDPIAFQLTRSVALDVAVTVHLQFSGSATAGQDYPAPSTTVTLQPGAATATFSITPTQDSINEIDENVIVTIAPSSAYTIGSPNNASAVIRGSGESRIGNSNLAVTGAFGFSATGFAGQIYRIESRPPDGPWRSRATGTAAADGSVNYRETSPVTSAPNPSEFYRIVWD